jgi:transcriptional regulator with XRE-family HTH domain
MSKQGGWPDTGFGRRLKAIRETKGLTADQLAEASGCHAMTISKLERGVQAPAWPLVLIFCKVLDVSCMAFIDETGAPPPEELKRSRGRPRKRKGATGQTDSGKPKRGRGRPRKVKPTLVLDPDAQPPTGSSAPAE